MMKGFFERKDMTDKSGPACQGPDTSKDMFKDHFNKVEVVYNQNYHDNKDYNKELSEKFNKAPRSVGTGK